MNSGGKKDDGVEELKRLQREQQLLNQVKQQQNKPVEKKDSPKKSDQTPEVRFGAESNDRSEKPIKSQLKGILKQPYLTKQPESELQERLLGEQQPESHEMNPDQEEEKEIETQDQTQNDVPIGDTQETTSEPEIENQPEEQGDEEEKVEPTNEQITSDEIKDKIEPSNEIKTDYGNELEEVTDQPQEDEEEKI